MDLRIYLLEGKLATPAVREHERWLAQHHAALMARGCRRCGSAVPGRVCPDCYTCRACRPLYDAPACTECRPNHHPSNYP